MWKAKAFCSSHKLSIGRMQCYVFFYYGWEMARRSSRCNSDCSQNPHIVIFLGIFTSPVIGFLSETKLKCSSTFFPNEWIVHQEWAHFSWASLLANWEQTCRRWRIWMCPWPANACWCSRKIKSCSFTFFLGVSGILETPPKRRSWVSTLGPQRFCNTKNLIQSSSPWLDWVREKRIPISLGPLALASFCCWL